SRLQGCSPPGPSMLERHGDGPIADITLLPLSEELVTDPSLQVEISDAVSERDKVKFTVQTKIPPAPPRPDFETSREKLQRLGEGNSTLTREEFAKMKQELDLCAACQTHLKNIILLPTSNSLYAPGPYIALEY
uniref:Sorting nexin 32 n=1 Tax=Chelonoidis abingdonii TaxID=106734 RepID=A0A8C0IXZ9_CHEAB